MQVLGATVLCARQFLLEASKDPKSPLTMWKVQIGKAIKEVRFVLKQSKEHQGAWRFIETRFHELRILNQTTFWHGAEINHNFKTPSAIHFIYGDVDGTEEMVLSDDLSCDEVENIFKEKVAFGLTLERHKVENNEDRALPMEVVESRTYQRHLDDGF